MQHFAEKENMFFHCSGNGRASYPCRRRRPRAAGRRSAGPGRIEGPGDLPHRDAVAGKAGVGKSRNALDACAAAHVGRVAE
jgi:hypothetical protein